MTYSSIKNISTRVLDEAALIVMRKPGGKYRVLKDRHGTSGMDISASELLTRKRYLMANETSVEVPEADVRFDG